MHKIVWFVITISLVVAVVYLVMTEERDRDVSDLANDETITFFRTSAWFDEAAAEWQVPIHGWIYEPEDSSARKSLFSTVLEGKYGLTVTDETDRNFSERLNLLIADNERGKRVVINIAGQNHTLPLSEVNGHFRTTLQIRPPIADGLEEVSAIRYVAVTRRQDAREFIGEALLVPPVGFSIISDIDDTVKISGVTDRRSLLENTFLLDFRAVPGMAELYTDWLRDDGSLHFVSSSPWQLHAPLADFLDANGFPASSLNLKAVRFRDETLFDLFEKGTETKPATIEGILNAYPAHQFVLVGDSGEQDPEVYAGLIKKYPGQIEKIYIRNVTGESADNQRFRSVFDGIDSGYWQLFDDPGELSPPDVPRTAGAN